jgi:hypothetical protein
MRFLRSHAIFFERLCPTNKATKLPASAFDPAVRMASNPRRGGQKFFAWRREFSAKRLNALMQLHYKQ